MMHDPGRAVETLRDHLSRHDKPIAFLFGAGTSCAPRRVGTDEPLIPAIGDLTRRCREAAEDLGPPFVDAWALIAQESTRIEGNDLIEAVLSRVHLKLDAVGEADSLVGLDHVQLAQLEQTIRQTIASAVQPPQELVPVDLPHHDLARWLGRSSRQRPVEIFTTNYDLLIERALEDERQPVFDGFVGSHRPFFHPESLTRADLAPGSAWVRLWKLHGSVNWSWHEVHGRRRIVRTEPTGSGELVLPSSRKYDESRKEPYVALLERLGRFLTQDDALLISCGYGFCDEHINSVVFDALAGPSRTHLIALQFEDPEPNSALARAAERRRNLTVLGPSRAWIGSLEAPWLLPEPVTNATSRFMDVAFDSDAEPDPAKPGTTGRLRLGDFTRLCAFLRGMTEESGASR